MQSSTRQAILNEVQRRDTEYRAIAEAILQYFDLYRSSLETPSLVQYTVAFALGKPGGSRLFASVKQVLKDLGVEHTRKSGKPYYINICLKPEYHATRETLEALASKHTSIVHKAARRPW